MAQSRLKREHNILAVSGDIEMASGKHFRRITATSGTPRQLLCIFKFHLSHP